MPKTEPPRSAKPRVQRRVSPARQAAFDILLRVESESAYASTLLANLGQSGMDERDCGLTHALVLGVLRWQKTLDHLIGRCSNRSIAKLDVPVRIALRLGLYQMRFMTRIPVSAAVNESVSLVRRARLASAASMVNATLRALARQPNELTASEIADPVERLAVELSHPRWMLERWIAQFGLEQATALARANNEPAPSAFRINTTGATEAQILGQLEREGVRAEPSSLTRGAFVSGEGVAPASTESARGGHIYLQSEASQMVALLLAPEKGDRVLDLCAAPGSKTTHLAALTANLAWIVAADRHPSRLKIVLDTCSRLGVDCVSAIALDGALTLPFGAGAMFDRVLVDAPCSGTGTLRENPEVKWRLSAGNISRLASLQLDLLRSAAERVGRGGRLVYSTCSIEPEETEEVIRQFLAGGATFRIVPAKALESALTEEGFLRTYPHVHNTDGFFAAVLEKTTRPVP